MDYSAKPTSKSSSNKPSKILSLKPVTLLPTSKGQTSSPISINNLTSPSPSRSYYNQPTQQSNVYNYQFFDNITMSINLPTNLLTRRLSTNFNYPIPIDLQNAIILITTVAQKLTYPSYVTCNPIGVYNGIILNVIASTTIVSSYSSNLGLQQVTNAQNNMLTFVNNGYFASQIPYPGVKVVNIQFSKVSITNVTTTSNVENLADDSTNLSDGSIAAIVICSIIGFVLITFGIRYYFSKTKVSAVSLVLDY